MFFFFYRVTANLHFKETFGEKEFPIWKEDVVCGFRFAVVKTSCAGFYLIFAAESLSQVF